MGRTQRAERHVEPTIRPRPRRCFDPAQQAEWL